MHTHQKLRKLTKTNLDFLFNSFPMLVCVINHFPHCERLPRPFIDASLDFAEGTLAQNFPDVKLAHKFHT